MRNRSLIFSLSLISLGLFGFYDSASVSYEIKQIESSLDPNINLKLTCSGNLNLHVLIQNFKSTPVTFSLEQIRVENSPKPLQLDYSSLKSNLSIRPRDGFAKDSALITTSVSLNYGEVYEARFSASIPGKAYTVTISMSDEEKMGVRKFTCSSKL